MKGDEPPNVPTQAGIVVAHFSLPPPPRHEAPGPAVPRGPHLEQYKVGPHEKILNDYRLHATVSRLQIVAQFRLRTKKILLTLRGFALAPDTPMSLLRDGDIVVVTANNMLEVCACHYILLCKYRW